MTEEQIKQNAEICVFTENSFRKEHKKLILTPSEEEIAKDFYIAGAHSRDEEIAQWKESKRKLRLRLMQRIHELSNPWISVDERLPEKINKFMSEPVLCRYTRGGKEYYHVTQYDFDYNQWMIGNVTHWMSIPELKN